MCSSHSLSTYMYIYTYIHVHTRTGKPVVQRPIVQKNRLSIVTTVGWLVSHLSGTNAPLYKDHLSTKTTITWSLEWLL